MLKHYFKTEIVFMLEKFKKHLETTFPDLINQKFFVAVSGGIDSMVLVHLLQKCNYYFGMLHCNFNLRGKESDDDMNFVMTYGDKFLIPYNVGHFQTKKHANKYKLSIQVAARELRYDWFYEQMNLQEIDFVLTAHHLDDALETFIINLSRGTGIDGLLGIPEQNSKIIRPLLPFSREEITVYANINTIQWREDSSNESDKYVRNKIRHKIAPLLKELNSDFLNSFFKTQKYLKETSHLAQDAVALVKKIVCEEKENDLYIDLKKLMHFSNYKSYLYQILKKYNFTAWNDVYDLVNAQTGKKMVSSNFILLKNRNHLILSKLSEHKEDSISTIYAIKRNENQVKIPLKITFSKVNDISQSNTSCIFVDDDLLEYPLFIKRWEEGDFFYPFGMKGSKKVSKFFKDEKFSMLDKQKTWLLCSKTEVVWIINHRADDRFKVTDKTLNILKISTE